MPVLLEVWGKHALFTRPELKIERVSYDVLTPSAARGILEAIYWKPRIEWIIQKIHVINRIQFQNIRRNEVSYKGDTPFKIEDKRTQRTSMVLKDVRYVIDARFRVLEDDELEEKAKRFKWNLDKVSEKEREADKKPEKHLEIFERRAGNGQAHKQPVFGCREFPVYFDLLEIREEGLLKHKIDFWKKNLKEEELNSTQDCPIWLEGTHDLGWMVWDLNFVNAEKFTPRMFRAEMKNGVIITDPTKVEVKG